MPQHIVLQEMQASIKAEKAQINRCWEGKVQKHSEQVNDALLKQKSEVSMQQSLPHGVHLA